MVRSKVACIIILFSFATKILPMDGPMLFKFMAFIQNNSKSPISYIDCWGHYDVSRELDKQEIPVDSTLPIARGEGNSGIFKLLVAGAKHSIINIPDIVWINCNAPDIVWVNGYQPHDPNLTKRKSNGYRVKFDTWPYTEDCVPVIQGQCVHVKVDENNAITFEVKRDDSSYLPASNTAAK